MNKVEVGRARKVGVAGAWAAGNVHAVNRLAIRVKPMRKESILVFIFVSSLPDYIPP
jgi:hypothetical protein